MLQYIAHWGTRVRRLVENVLVINVQPRVSKIGRRGISAPKRLSASSMLAGVLKMKTHVTTIVVIHTERPPSSREDDCSTPSPSSRGDSGTITLL